MTPEEHLTAVLDALGFRHDPEARDTPARMLDFLRAYAPNRPAPDVDCFPAPGPDPVVLRGLPFHSLCVHHLLPFFGEADIAYRPSGRIAGLGSIVRTLRHFARQPQLQERLGAEIADRLYATLDAPVLVRLHSRQMCMEMRGIESAGRVETLTARGPDAERLSSLLDR